MVRCLGPLASAVMNGRLMSVVERAGELHLGLLRRLAHALHGHLVLLQVDAGLALELLDDVVHEGVVHVRAAQLGIPAGRHDLEPAFLPHLHDRDVQRSAAQVEHQDLQLLAGLLQPIGQTGRRGLVDDAQDLQPGDLAGVLGGRALVVVEIGGAGDDHLLHRVSQVSFRVLLDLLQDERRDLLGAVLFAEDLELVVRPHLALGRVDRAVRVDGRLTARRLAHQPIALLGERHEGRERLARGDPGALRRGDDHGPAAFHDGGRGVRGPQVDAYYPSHILAPLVALSLSGHAETPAVAVR